MKNSHNCKFTSDKSMVCSLDPNQIGLLLIWTFYTNYKKIGPLSYILSVFLLIFSFKFHLPPWEIRIPTKNDNIRSVFFLIFSFKFSP